MNPQILEKLSGFVAEAESISKLLLDPAVLSDRENYKDLQRKFKRAEDLAKLYHQWQSLQKAQEEAKEYIQSDSSELRQLGTEEAQTLAQKLKELEGVILEKLIPEDLDEGKNIYLEIRAGSGGNEAAIFCADLYRMYSRFTERNRWGIELVSVSHAELGGYKEVIAKISGQGAWAKLRFESGVHRVQRVPVTESQGRIHTSAASVAILPEASEIGEIEISPSDLRIDTFRASGAGGQHVNKTDSAIRITHLPTKIVVECQSERSQHKNKAQAMSLLRARLLKMKRKEAKDAQGEIRRSQVGTGDRSERIRTYNFPQGRISDHRINLTMHNLEEVLDGKLDELIEPIANQWRAEQIQ